MAGNIVLTPTALEHFSNILRYTKKKYGSKQMLEYSALLKKGFNEIAINHRNEANKHLNWKDSTGFELQHIQHYYVVYKIIEGNIFVIAGIFHHSMDMPNRLKELGQMSKQEIATLTKKLN
ncbi:MAG: type II toxin-antitoxin system RelE/ParE family toxin [Rickettsiales bacterium]